MITQAECDTAAASFFLQCALASDPMKYSANGKIDTWNDGMMDQFKYPICYTKHTYAISRPIAFLLFYCVLGN